MKRIFIFLLTLVFLGGHVFAQNSPNNANAGNQQQGGTVAATDNTQSSDSKQLTTLEAKMKAARKYRESFSKVLIDFTKIDPKYDADTEVNFAYLNNFSLSKEEVDKLTETFSHSNWEVYPQKSIYLPNVLVKSYTKPVEVNAGKYAGQTVLGIRLHFPNYENVTMTAFIQPPFIPKTYTDKFLGKGLIKNVGIVKSAYITVYGLNNPEKIYVVTTDNVGNEFTYGFGALNFTGWRTLEWINPSYVDIKSIRSLEVSSDVPLYPSNNFNRVLKGIQITKPNQNRTMDMVTYVRDISLTYDKAVDEKLLLDIDNEAVWNIIEESSSSRDMIQFRRSLNRRYIKYLEKRKKFDYEKKANNNQTSPPTNTTTQ